jgi:pilus assembly protein CpaB
MRNPRAALMLVAALVSAFGATLLAAKWLDRKTSTPIARIALAAHDLPVGHRISTGDIRMTEWPGAHRPVGSFVTAAELEGRVVRSNLQSHEPLLESKLAPKGSKGGLSAVIGEGKRAMTVRVNDVVGVAGFALPGNFVDVMVSTRDDRASGSGSGGESMISKIVLERILVLAVAQEAGRDDTKPRVVNAVTLEVTPLEAERLDLSRSVGQLSLVLRNQIDPSPVRTSGATKDGLLFGAETGAQRPVAIAAASTPPAARAPHTGAGPAVSVRAAPLPAVAVAAAPRHCVDALVGHERQSECF